MKYLNEDFLNFFKALESNNSKEWFDENRKHYEKAVKKPFKNLALELCKALQPYYPNVDLSNNFSISRINRDIRFSADKTPYKDHMGVMILPGGKKDKTRPGFYMQANHKDVRVYSGSYMPDKDQLLLIRTYILHNLEEFNTLVNAKEFVDSFGEIRGDKNKRLSANFKDTMEIQPLIANKSFYWFFKLKPEVITQDDLINQLITGYEKSLPLNNFFEKALGY
jgi:uncharacterized protein (TIGR02453 family)